MKVVISGASGLVGKALANALQGDGHEVVRLVRREPGSGEIRWSVLEQTIDASALEGCDAVIHMAGAPIADKRWTEARKAVIRDSRVDGTRLLAQALAGLEKKPAVLVSGSAVGFYGACGDEEVTEDTAAGTGFLAEVCSAWEQAAQPAADAGIRLVWLRTGVVMAEEGGALAKMLPAFKMGVGGPMGSGRQYLPWIALADHVRAIRHCIDSDLSGPVNATAPNPVPQREFASTLGRVLRRPAFAPAPAFALKLLLGQMADEALLTGQRVVPKALLASGFEFEFGKLEPALRSMLDA